MRGQQSPGKPGLNCSLLPYTASRGQVFVKGRILPQVALTESAIVVPVGDVRNRSPTAVSSTPSAIDEGEIVCVRKKLLDRYFVSRWLASRRNSTSRGLVISVP